jgi:DNA invertase Pin-like site-specific DNA recombinase
MARKVKHENQVKAVAYLRTSSAANVGEDKDSGKRQTEAIEAHARRAGIELVGTYYDEAGKGTDPIDVRPGFAAMLERIEGNGVRTIIVETSNRFARDLMVQEVGFAMLQKRGIDIIAADSPTAFLDDTPTARLIRQVLGAVSEFDKAMTVAKLRGARDRKRRDTGKKVEGRKSWLERNPEAVRAAKELQGAGVRPVSLRKIAAELAKQGHRAKNGNELSPSVVKAMIETA